MHLCTKKLYKQVILKYCSPLPAPPSQAYQSGMRYPGYMFLTFASYVERWWEVLNGEDECTPEELESVLLNSLTTLQFEFLNDLNTTTDTGIVSVLDAVYCCIQKKCCIE